MSFAVTGTTEDIRELLFGPAQHDEHCRGYRWELYLQSAKLASAAVREEAKRIIARANDQIEYSEAAE